MRETTETEATGGAWLRALRTSAGMTNEQVAIAAGISTSYLSQVENGLKTPTAGWVQLVTVAIGTHLVAHQDAA